MSSVVNGNISIAKQYDFVIGLDLGTSRSGYALSPTVSNGNGSNVSQVLTDERGKIPTLLLLKNNATMDLIEFGDEAESIFTQLENGSGTQEVLLFNNFKLLLYRVDALSIANEIKDFSSGIGALTNVNATTNPTKNNNNNHNNGLTVEPINHRGMQVPLHIVLQRSLEALSQRAMTRLKKLSAVVQPNRIKYVLSCPAIWSAVAMRIMRDASVAAGLPSNQVFFVLEPEAAAVTCRMTCLSTTKDTAPSIVASGVSVLNSNVDKKHTTNLSNAQPQNSKPKRCFMVADLGGGTADFTIHEIVDESKDIVVEKCPSSGGIWGSSVVNQCFWEFLKRLLGSDTMNKFAAENPLGWLMLMKNFDLVKHHFDPRRLGSSKHVSIQLPSAVSELVKERLALLPAANAAAKNSDSKSKNALGTQIPYLEPEAAVDWKSVLMESEKQSHNVAVQHLLSEPVNVIHHKPETKLIDGKNTSNPQELVTPLVTPQLVQESILNSNTMTITTPSAMPGSASVNTATVVAATATSAVNATPNTKIGGVDVANEPTVTASVTVSVPMLWPTSGAQPDLTESDSKLVVPESNVWFKNDYLKIPTTLMAQFFDHNVNSIYNYLKKWCNEIGPRLQTIFFVGGFSESPVIHQRMEALRSEFPYLFLSTPPHPGEAVLTGSVLYGLRPEQIRARIAPATYVMRTLTDWTPEMDKYQPTAQKETLDGRDYCSNGLAVIVTKGSEINTSSATWTQMMRPPPCATSSRVMFLFGRCDSLVPPPIYAASFGIVDVGKFELNTNPIQKQEKNGMIKKLRTHADSLSVQVHLSEREMRVQAYNITRNEVVLGTITALDTTAPVCVVDK